MYPHLQTAIDAQVKLCVLIHATGVAGLQTRNLHLHRLLVELKRLSLTGILSTVNTGGQHVVDRSAAGILLNVDSGDIQLAFGRSVVAVVEVEVIAAPFAAHQLKGRETQVRNGLEVGHEDTGKTYG